MYQPENPNGRKQLDFTHQVILAMAFISFGALYRVLSHMRIIQVEFNLAPIGAMALVAGAYMRGWLAICVPIIATLISDVYIGFYSGAEMAFVYFAYVIGALIGRFVISKDRNVGRISAGAVLNLFSFFLISNFGTWLSGVYYPRTWEGLINCYGLAIPFMFRGTLIGDIAFVAVFFGALEFALRNSPQQVTAPVRVEE